ncbi:SHOCT domain-containing protein [Natronolimnobius sp. AArcel1]|uniref:SHOCT domain-containing protein n=1 Tax=Natronolimnobius sp. AArcel1 TaxID=1679093 RepID=UPI0013EC0DB6|nr:SHOCT domain-containing protein [Natronolimnobius sp. AArcel1]NGM68678.1 SHOCT domain-containing protein [Natronolimnobius sp. AArcel1]
MYELVHQFAPESPAGRTAVAIAVSLLGVPALLLAFFGLSGAPFTTVILLFLFSAVTLSAAGCLTLGVVRQANAAPDATPLTEPRTESTRESETPIETLRRRYADGKLSDEEFDHRLDRLLESETESSAQPTTERERLLE